MKKLAFIIFGIFILNPLFGQDPNILIGLNSPSYGVRIKANWPNTTTGWARSFSISNQDNTQTFFGIGAMGSATNGLASFDYGYIGKDYNQTFMSFLANGNVGIGTTTPSAKLQVYTSGAGNAQTWGNSNTVNTSIYDYNTSPNSPSIVFGDGTGWKFHIAKKSDNGATKFLTIQDNNGNVGIGITNPQYKLTVEGTIGAREVKVTAEAWSDFVFHPTYKLRTLGEVEQFIKTNNHLPEIPTEAEVKENGVGLGEMNAKLLQKIEELTLYMIEMKKENEKQKLENQVLKDRIEKIEVKIR